MDVRNFSDKQHRLLLLVEHREDLHALPADGTARADHAQFRVRFLVACAQLVDQPQKDLFISLKKEALALLRTVDRTDGRVGAKHGLKAVVKRNDSRIQWDMEEHLVGKLGDELIPFGALAEQILVGFQLRNRFPLMAIRLRCHRCPDEQDDE